MIQDEPKPSDSSESSLVRMFEQALANGSAPNDDVDQPNDQDDSENPKAATEIAAGVLRLAEAYRGAFPHPAVLRELNEVVANGAERAFSMTELEQKHRHEMDKAMIESDHLSLKHEWQDRRIVIIITFTLLFASLGCAFYAVMTNHPAGSGLAGGGALIALLGLFVVRGRKKSSKDSKESDS